MQILRCLSCRGVNWNRIFLSKFLHSIFSCLSCRGVNWNKGLWPDGLNLLAASHVEAWIEIRPSPADMSRKSSCLSCRGVNWNFISSENSSSWHCCLSCRGVNWNTLYPVFNHLSCAASHVEAWIEISAQFSVRCPRCCLSCRGVNWNMTEEAFFSSAGQLPLM